MKKIGVVGAHALTQGQWRLLHALAEVFAVRIDKCDYGEGDAVDAWIFPCAVRDDLPGIEASTLPAFVVLSTEGSLTSGDSAAVEFAQNGAVPSVFAGRAIPLEDSPGLSSLPKWLLEFASPVCWKGDLPVWAVRTGLGGTRHFVATALPEVSADGVVYLHFSQDRFLALLPLIAFLRQVTEDPRWEEPPIQACFMFDDPNLHWRTYGYIDFARLARHAMEHDYHVASATIPLDSWFVHGPTAALFRRHADRLSLLFHGNDHLNEELARNVDAAERMGMLAQAIRRIESLERRARVDVSRVMAPPHGACAEATLAAMALLGYEAACISRSSLRHFNPGASWARGVGMRPSDVVRGMPVLPRFRVSPRCQSSILLSILLRQPIIPVGHHQDVAEGFDVFADLAAFINSLGKVRWASLSSIARSHFSQLTDGNVLHLRMHTVRADLVVPPGVDFVVVDRPWPGIDSREPLRIASEVRGAPAEVLDPTAPIAVCAGQHLRIFSGPTPIALSQAPRRSGLRPWPVLRRLLTEMRDRVAPIVQRR